MIHITGARYLRLFLAFLCFAPLAPPSHAADTINIVLLPDLYQCHHVGADIAISERSSIGVLGSYECKSDRPTYGDSNGSVDNTFTRVLFPWRHFRRDVFGNGPFVQFMLGTEESKFRSDAGSRADVRFIDLGLHAGYQWHWDSGFNISALIGLAVLVRSSLDKEIAATESRKVIDFLDKNTKTNAHPGAGVIFGWSF